MGVQLGGEPPGPLGLAFLGLHCSFYWPYIYKYPSDGRKEQTMGSTEKLQPLVSLLEHSSNKWNCNWHHVAMMCNDGLYK